MATNWFDHYAQCPYYRHCDGKKKVICQGVSDGSRLCWEFGNSEDLNIQVKVFCCDKYKNCEVYQMLKQIYEDDDNG